MQTPQILVNLKYKLKKNRLYLGSNMLKKIYILISHPHSRQLTDHSSSWRLAADWLLYIYYIFHRWVFFPPLIPLKFAHGKAQFMMHTRRLQLLCLKRWNEQWAFVKVSQHWEQCIFQGSWCQTGRLNGKEKENERKTLPVSISEMLITVALSFLSERKWRKMMFFLKNPNEESRKFEQTWKRKSCFFSDHWLQQELEMLSENWRKPLTTNTGWKIVTKVKMSVNQWLQILRGCRRWSANLESSAKFWIAKTQESSSTTS